MKIVSLLPAATEMVCLLGLESSLVGISDDNDYPESVLKLPKITTSSINNSLSSLEIDKRVKTAKHRGSSVFHIDRVLLSKLAPDLILTQELCPVCALALSDVEKATRQILKDTKIISLEPHTIADIFENIQTIAQNVILSYSEGSSQDSSAKPQNDKIQIKAKKVIADLRRRLSNISKKLVSAPKPSVLIIEWLDPLMIAGHWVPEMVEKAGGKMLIVKDPSASSGQEKEPSKNISWDDVLQLNPDIIIIAPCGFGIDRTLEEISSITNKKEFKNVKAYKNKQIFLVDGNAYLTRPGPRIVDGVEILAEIFHPQIFPRKYPSSSWREL